MTAKVLDGNTLASRIRNSLKGQIQELTSERERPPGLSVILVGDDPSSTLYVRLKKKDCQEIGIKCDVYHLAPETNETELQALVERLNADSKTDGILIQLPLPPHLNSLRIIELIDPRKDVDGVTPFNMGMLTLREPAHRSCTPKGVMTLLQQTGWLLRGKHAIVLGASNHVGRPMGLELLLVGCTVTTAHKFTPNTKELTLEADIVVSATGKPKLIKGDWIKPGAIVIDVGIERQADGSLVGDIDFESVAPVASWLTPVPGGVGPMTRVSILQNVIDSFTFSNR